MARILIAEDDVSLCKMIAEKLGSAGYSVEYTHRGDDALTMAQTYTFDLFILDWNLPGLTGLDICRALRKDRKTEPILMLTAMSDLSDKEAGLDSGADDYLTKPFEMRELAARVRSLLRRPPQYMGEILRFGDAILDINAGQLKRGEKSVHLQPREASLLEFFIRRQDHVLNQESLLAGVWGSDFDGSETALRSCLAKVRKALAQLEFSDAIETVHGFGYRLKNPS